jgi:hypothetical protein
MPFKKIYQYSIKPGFKVIKAFICSGEDQEMDILRLKSEIF